LDGWTRDEAVEGLISLGHDQSKAEEVYRLRGGIIRDLIAACECKELFREEIDRVVDQLGDESMTMALQSTMRNADPLSPDSLRTMFFDKMQRETKDSNWKVVMHAIQVVDSKYALNRLAERLSAEEFLRSYKFCLKHGMRASAGSFFERIIHQSMKSSPPCSDNR
jgi:hypothetical protein